MEVKFNAIEEKDTDFAIIRSFLENEKVRELFFNKIGKRGDVVKVYHSLMQTESDGHDGESDVVFILENDKERFAIFIEDKIAADPQPKQRERYDDRAILLSDIEKYKKHYVFLCAPQAYLDTAKADGYELTVSHEEIDSQLDKNSFEHFIFNFSTEVKTQGYTPIVNNSVTEFWLKLYDYIDEHYPNLNINRITSGRGSSAIWPIFRKQGIKGLSIIWKTEGGFIDLEFAGMTAELEMFTDMVKKLNLDKYEVVETRKSMSLRINIPKSKIVTFHRPFDEQLENIRYCLNKVNELNKVTNKILLNNYTKFPL